MSTHYKLTFTNNVTLFLLEKYLSRSPRVPSSTLFLVGNLINISLNKKKETLSKAVCMKEIRHL